jgi:hypothetical protein
LGCYLRANALRTEADWLMARGQAQAQEYASSFDGTFADQQLLSFDQRRMALERAQLWLLFEKLLILVCVVGMFSSYVLYLFKRIRDEIEEAITEDAPPDMSRPPALL